MRRFIYSFSVIAVVTAVIAGFALAPASASSAHVAAGKDAVASARSAAHRATAYGQRTTSSYRQLINHNGKCLDMTNASTSRGTQPQEWACNGRSQQYWETIPVSTPVGGAHYLLKNYHSGLCLSILNNSTKPGSRVIQWTCNTSGNDLFEDWGPSCPGSYSPYCVWYDLGMETSTNCCALHPSGDRTANGLKIYANNDVTLRAYRWKWGGSI